jgi:hypothetical protein
VSEEEGIVPGLESARSYHCGVAGGRRLDVVRAAEGLFRARKSNRRSTRASQRVMAGKASSLMPPMSPLITSIQDAKLA